MREREERDEDEKKEKIEKMQICNCRNFLRPLFFRLINTARIFTVKLFIHEMVLCNHFRPHGNGIRTDAVRDLR